MYRVPSLYPAEVRSELRPATLAAYLLADRACTLEHKDDHVRIIIFGRDPEVGSDSDTLKL